MLASLLFGLHYRRFLRACGNPLAAQSSRLGAILRQSERSGIGRANEFAALARIADPARRIAEFQARIPIRTWAQMGDDLDRVYAGEWDLLCPSRPRFFALTAGSTGGFKHLPMTREFRRELGRGSLIVYGAMERCVPELRQLKAQFLVGSAEGGNGPDGTPQGFASGFNYRNLPWLLRRRFVLPYWIFTLDDAEERGYAAGRILVEQRQLGALCAISPVNLTNLREALERNAPRLFADIEAGTLTMRGRAAVPGDFHCRPNPELAEDLRRSWQDGGKLSNRRLFPSLRVLVCWQGGNMGYYLHELDQAFDLDQHFEFPISASEGLFAIPYRMNQAGGILAITSHFLEFVPDGAPDAMALRADQLVPGGEYRLIVTNSGGLYRYDMEDVVRVTGFHRRTPVIEFVSKKDRQISVANERITELDVTRAMEAASRSAGLWCREFLFVPCSDRRYRVVLDGTVLTALEADQRDARLSRFAAEVERQLRLTARGYDFEREDALLEPLQLIVTAAGELRAFVGPRPEQLEVPNAQIKPVHLTRQFNAHRSFTAILTYAA
jgi:hypothetical protein